MTPGGTVGKSDTLTNMMSHRWLRLKFSFVRKVCLHLVLIGFSLLHNLSDLEYLCLLKLKPVSICLIHVNCPSPAVRHMVANENK